MIHLRIDSNELNKDAKFACGIGWPLPTGDKYFFFGESAGEIRSDCPKCNPNPRRLGIPLSQLTKAQFERIEQQHYQEPE
jgi:hypothetical protein